MLLTENKIFKKSDEQLKSNILTTVNGYFLNISEIPEADISKMCAFLYRLIIKEPNFLTKIKPIELPKDATEFDIKDATNGILFTFSPNKLKLLFNNKINHTLDWLRDTYKENKPVDYNQLRGIQSLDYAYNIADRYFKEKNNKIKTNKNEEGLETVLKLPNGYVWVKLTTKECYDLEGKRMGHCVGSYFNAKSIEIYSLRDSQNNPHVTIEFEPVYGEIRQIKGKENKDVVSKYNLMVVEFLKLPMVKKIKTPDFKENLAEIDNSVLEDLYSTKPELAPFDFIYNKYGMSEATLKTLNNMLDDYGIKPVSFDFKSNKFIIEKFPNIKQLVYDNNFCDQESYLTVMYEVLSGSMSFDEVVDLGIDEHEIFQTFSNFNKHQKLALDKYISKKFKKQNLSNKEIWNLLRENDDQLISDLTDGLFNAYQSGSYNKLEKKFFKTLNHWSTSEGFYLLPDNIKTLDTPIEVVINERRFIELISDLGPSGLDDISFNNCWVNERVTTNQEDIWLLDYDSSIFDEYLENETVLTDFFEKDN